MRHPFRYPFALQAQNSPHCAQRGAPARLQGIFIRQRGPWAIDMGDSGAPPPGKGGGQAGGGERRSKLASEVPQAEDRSNKTSTGSIATADRDGRRQLGTHTAATVHQHGASRLRRRNSRHRTNAARNRSSRRKHQEHEHEGLSQQTFCHESSRVVADSRSDETDARLGRGEMHPPFERRPNLPLGAFCVNP